MSDDASYRVTADELRQFIERWERLQAEKQDIADTQKEVMAEAKARGYDVKVMRLVIAMRKRDPSDLAEQNAVLDMYCGALGMDSGSIYRDMVDDGGPSDAEEDDGIDDDDLI